MNGDTPVYLVGCGKRKRDGPCPAKELYVGSLFTAARHYVESTGQPWAILSAKYGVVHPDKVIEPYDKKMPTAFWPLRMWGACAQVDLCSVFFRHHPEWFATNGRGIQVFRPEVRFVIYAGRDYVHPLKLYTSLRDRLEEPLAGLGIGERLRFFQIALALEKEIAHGR